MRRFLLVLVRLAPCILSAQCTQPPVIDVHLHAPLDPGPVDTFAGEFARYVAEMDSLNVRMAVLNGAPDVLYDWTARAPERMIPALLFPCENGIAANWGRPCFANGTEFPDLTWLRGEIKAGRIKALGEITTQYMGIAPDDPRMEPYFALAEEFDLPVFIQRDWARRTPHTRAVRPK